MTDKEKAKAYDNALRKMQEIIAMDNNPVVPKEIGEYLFTELSESKDERVRKWIIDFARGQIDGYMLVDDDESHEIAEIWKEAIAYLEKQKEQNHDGKKWLTLEQDLLRGCNYNSETDTYTKNW